MFYNVRGGIVAKSSGGGGRSGRGGADYTGAPSFGRESVTRSKFGNTRGQVLRREIPITRQSTGRFGGSPQVASLQYSATAGNWSLRNLGGKNLGTFSNLRDAKRAGVSYASNINRESDL